jgi:hypothetical protein
VDAKTQCEADPAFPLQAHIEPGQRVYQTEAAPHGPLGSVFMGLGIAKVDEEPIPQILGDMAVEALHDLCTHAVIGVDHLTEIFGIKLPSEARGVHQITK